MNNVRTVSDTKRAFHAAHTRPINSVHRRVVEELMVEMHLLAVGSYFRYTPVYALGVVTTYDRFMVSYKPESDRDSIFTALCVSASQVEASQYRQDATALLEAAKTLSVDAAIAALQGEDGGDGATQIVKGAVEPLMRGDIKYSRLLGIGLFTILEATDSDLVNDGDRLKERLVPICEALNLPVEKLAKDLELYRSNLEKLAMAQETMKDVLQAERKQREQRAKAKEAKEADAKETQDSEETVKGEEATVGSGSDDKSSKTSESGD